MPPGKGPLYSGRHDASWSVCGTAVLCLRGQYVCPGDIPFAGTVPTASHARATLLFALYEEQTGGVPLWAELQTVEVDPDGRYEVILGISTDGLPLEPFADGSARWLGVQPEGEAELPRVLLVSVPYALKSADADTLGGLPPEAYLTAATFDQRLAHASLGLDRRPAPLLGPAGLDTNTDTLTVSG